MFSSEESYSGLVTLDYRESKISVLQICWMVSYSTDGRIPAGIWCENDTVLTSMRRDYVASTLIRRHYLLIALY